MIIVILMPETLSYLSCFAEPSMDTFSTFSQHFSQPRLLHGLQQWRRFPNTLALVVGVPPAGQQDQRAIPGSCSETPQRNLLTWVPRVIEKGGRGMSNLPCVNFAPIQVQFFWAAFEKDPGRSFPRAKTCADDSAQKLGATPHLHSIYWLVGSFKNWKHLASSSTLSLERSFSSSV